MAKVTASEDTSGSSNPNAFEAADVQMSNCLASGGGAASVTETTATKTRVTCTRLTEATACAWWSWCALP